MKAAYFAGPQMSVFYVILNYPFGDDTYSVVILDGSSNCFRAAAKPSQIVWNVKSDYLRLKQRSRAAAVFPHG